MTLVVDQVWKSYPRWPHGHRTARDIIARRMPMLRGGEVRWALRDVSLEARSGEAIGIIGANGAGKSTLLRLAAGLGRATRGSIEVPPGTASVLSLGDVNPELTGRENVITAAIVTGFGRRRAREIVDDVIGFAELEDYVDAPVRTYSEGMKLRLAFGLVAQLQPPLLLVDEALAVGDVAFQEKGLQRVREMRAAGTTLVFASHDLDRIEAECDRALWLHAGEVWEEGSSSAVVSRYRNSMMSETRERTPPPEVGGPEDLELRRNRFGSQEVSIDEVVLSPAPSDPWVGEIVAGGGLTISFRIRANEEGVDGVRLASSILRREDGVKCCDALWELPAAGLDEPEGRLIELAYPRLDLAPGEYVVEVGAYRHDWAYAYDFHTQLYELRVVGHEEGKGLYLTAAEWRLADREPAELSRSVG